MTNYTADIQYIKLLDRIIHEGKNRGDRTGTGTRSIFSHTIEIDMAHGFPLLTTKKMFTKGIVHELLWFLNGDTNIKYLVDNDVHIWTSDAYKAYLKNFVPPKPPLAVDVQPDYFEPMSKEWFIKSIQENTSRGRSFAMEYGDLGPIYGKQWVNWGQVSLTDGYNGINQIQQAIDKLINNPEDRRIIVSAWNVADIDKMTLPPCHWAFELYTEELTFDERKKYYSGSEKYDLDTSWGSRIMDDANTPKRRLSLKWHQRSVDTFLGLPFNIASYGLLLHMLAQQTNMVAGTLIGDLTNVHIYNNHLEQCKEQANRGPREYPKLILNKAKDIFSYCYEDVKFVDYNPHPPIKGEISV